MRTAIPFPNVGSRRSRGQSLPRHRRCLTVLFVGALAFLSTGMVAGIVPVVAGTTDGGPKGPPRVAVPVETIDLGIVTRGEVREARFAVSNEGGQPLVIREARPGCKCTVIDYDEQILPGHIGYINATIDSHSLWGKVSRFVTLYTNDPTTPTQRLQIDAIVIGSVQLLPTDRVQLTNRKDTLARAFMLVRQDPTEEGTLVLTDLDVPTPWLAAKAMRLEEKRLAGDGIPVGRPGDYVIEVWLNGQPPTGRSEGEFVFRTGLEREPEVRIPVNVKFQPAVQLSREDIELSGDATQTLLVGIREGFDPSALTVVSEPAAIETRLEPSGQRHFKLHVSWQGSPGSGVITLSVGGEVYRVPVVKRAVAR